jgi:poly-gamma-glutamate synthesis protein (capsule biosynthesis protein)
MDRREFVVRSGAALAGLAFLRRAEAAPPDPLVLFLAGDVMTGRGVDQILPNPADPALPDGKDARRYIQIAERVSGSIPRDAAFDYVWGDALGELQRAKPAARIVNLETSVTTSGDPWPGKNIHYRMHPANVPVLAAAGVDVCVLGNNHVLDFGHAGLFETLRALRGAKLATTGAGGDLREAAAPAALETAAGRLLVFSCGAPGAGVPRDWAATALSPGVHLLDDLEPATAARLGDRILAHRRPGDRVIVSLHWGANWGYAVPAEQRAFAHRLVDAGAADIVHGHSSHHPKGMEIYRDRLILYGCGDLLNDYEGIGARGDFRRELAALYLPALDASGALTRLELVPMRIRRFRLERAAEDDARWLAERLDRESRKLGARLELRDGRLLLLKG